MIKCFFISLIFIGLSCEAEFQKDVRVEHLLQRVVMEYDLRPLPTKPYQISAKFILGQALFHDPLLSGNRDIACATCHLPKLGLSDGLPVSVGSMGIGIGKDRILPEGRPEQPRNALDLWNRDNNSARSMFWDGRVEMLDPEKRTFRSPLGKDLPLGFENAMSAQAIFPLIQTNEMLGLADDVSPSDLPEPHANKKNEFATESDGYPLSDRFRIVSSLLLRRLLGKGPSPYQTWQVKYRDLFVKAYPSVKVQDANIVHLANAISHYEEIAFATRFSPWDTYLDGDTKAISEMAKRGALLFYGRGRCVVCHSGPLFSDFDYYSIGVRKNNYLGREIKIDLGRYLATGDRGDKHKFRTPPLRNVTLTAPYFHNGSSATLQDVIKQHIDPLRYADQYEESGAFTMAQGEIRAISRILLMRDELSSDDIEALIAFLTTLQSGLSDAELATPASVPSGLSIFGAKSKLNSRFSE